MQWSSEGIIIGTKKHGETSLIIEAMVVGKGRHLGLVRGGRSAKLSPILQAGNSVKIDWRARLEEHLGVFSIELIKARAAELIAKRKRLSLSSLLNDHFRLLAERDPHDELLSMALSLLDSDKPDLEIAQDLAMFELRLLEELGFGLDIFSCAVSGETSGLTHVSPRTGRAVTLEHAQPYIDRLLPLPAFLLDEIEPSSADIKNALALSGYFLSLHVWLARQIKPPTTRDNLIKILL